MSYDVIATTPLNGLRDTILMISEHRDWRIVSVVPNGTHPGDFGNVVPAYMIVVQQKTMIEQADEEHPEAMAAARAEVRAGRPDVKADEVVTAVRQLLAEPTTGSFRSVKAALATYDEALGQPQCICSMGDNFGCPIHDVVALRD